MVEGPSLLPIWRCGTRCSDIFMTLVLPLSSVDLSTQWLEFRQTLVDDVVEVADELVRFLRSNTQSQGRYKVIYLRELLQQVEASASVLRYRSVTEFKLI